MIITWDDIQRMHAELKKMDVGLGVIPSSILIADKNGNEIKSSRPFAGLDNFINTGYNTEHQQTTKV